MNYILKSLQDTHLEDRKRDVHVIHHKLFDRGNQVITRPKAIKDDETLKKTKLDKQAEDTAPDTEAIGLDPTKCTTRVDNPDLLTIEMEYMSKF